MPASEHWGSWPHICDNISIYLHTHVHIHRHIHTYIALGKLANEEGEGVGQKGGIKTTQGGQRDSVHADPAGWQQGETAVVAVAVLEACHIPVLTRLECL